MEQLQTADDLDRMLTQLGVDLPDREHGIRCALMAGALFDGVHERLGLGVEDRQIAVTAALFHDVGYVRGARDHHRKSYDIVHGLDMPGLSLRDRLVVACAARYHGRTMPNIEHAGFGEMSTEDQHRTRRVSAIVRLAVASDASHLGLLTGARVDASGSRVLVTFDASSEPSFDRDRLHEAAGGFTALTYQPIQIEVNDISRMINEKKG